MVIQGEEGAWSERRMTFKSESMSREEGKAVLSSANSMWQGAEGQQWFPGWLGDREWENRECGQAGNEGQASSFGAHRIRVQY